MKNIIKTLASAAVIAIFLLLAWATSYDRNYYQPPFVDVTVRNESDSCTINQLQFVYRLRRDNNDTLLLGALNILPGDSLNFNSEALNFQKLNYTCQCPGLIFQEEINVQLDTVGINQIVLDCD